MPDIKRSPMVVPRPDAKPLTELAEVAVVSRFDQLTDTIRVLAREITGTADVRWPRGCPDGILLQVEVRVRPVSGAHLIPDEIVSAVPGELWNKVADAVEGTVIRTPCSAEVMEHMRAGDLKAAKAQQDAEDGAGSVPRDPGQ
jgi:hypothetical protein